MTRKESPVSRTPTTARPVAVNSPLGRTVRLDQVPDVLVAECYADYAAVAALGPYDADYQKKAAY